MLRNTFRNLFSITPAHKFTINVTLFLHGTKMSNWKFHKSHHQNCDWQREEGMMKPRDYYKKISKNLAYILRHGALKMNLSMNSSGFVLVDDILKLPQFRYVKKYEICRIVENNDKQRFILKKDVYGHLIIGANQGHTIRCENLQLKPITEAKLYPYVIHGTTYRAWSMIKETGLKTMGRNHIHFAIGEPGEAGVISGMRSNSQVLIYINLKKALKKGIKFFVSRNNVILSPGDKEGIISPVFFESTIDRKTRQCLT